MNTGTPGFPMRFSTSLVKTSLRGLDLAAGCTAPAPLLYGQVAFRNWSLTKSVPIQSPPSLSSVTCLKITAPLWGSASKKTTWRLILQGGKEFRPVGSLTLGKDYVAHDLNPGGLAGRHDNPADTLRALIIAEEQGGFFVPPFDRLIDHPAPHDYIRGDRPENIFLFHKIQGGRSGGRGDLHHFVFYRDGHDRTEGDRGRPDDGWNLVDVDELFLPGNGAVALPLIVGDEKTGFAAPGRLRPR